MARPLNRGAYPYIVFYKKLSVKNPIKSEMTIFNSPFNIIYARNGSEAVLIGREAIYDNLLLPYHSRRCYFEKLGKSKKELEKMKNYVSRETWESNRKES